MDPFPVVVLPEVCEFSLKVLGIPKEGVIKIFTANSSAESPMKGCDIGIYGMAQDRAKERPIRTRRGEPRTLTRPVLVGYCASSRPYHPAGTYSLPVSRLPIAKQQALGLINLGCQEGGTAAVWMDFLHESPVRLYDLFLAGPFIETQNFIGLVTCHFG